MIPQASTIKMMNISAIDIKILKNILYLSLV